jgi:hypothetical protein
MNMLLLAAISVMQGDLQDHDVPAWLCVDYDESYLFYPDYPAPENGAAK